MRRAGIERASRAIVADEVERGGCGTPGCDDPTCDVQYGECHCRCGMTAPLARQSERRRRHVRGEPHLYVRGHNRAGGTMRATDDGEPLADAIRRSGLSAAEIARRAGVGQSSVGELVRMRGWRLKSERCVAIVDVLRSAGLAVTLEALFTRDPLPDERVGDRRHRSERGAVLWPNEEWRDGRHFKRMSAELAELASDRDLVTQREAARILKVQPPAVARWVVRGRLVPVASKVGPLTATFLRRLDVEAFRSDLLAERRAARGGCAGGRVPAHIIDRMGPESRRAYKVRAAPKPGRSRLDSYGDYQAVLAQLAELNRSEGFPSEAKLAKLYHARFGVPSWGKPVSTYVVRIALGRPV